MLSVVAEGLSNETVAAQLFVSVGTVKRHMHNINGKLDATNRISAVARARALLCISTTRGGAITTGAIIRQTIGAPIIGVRTAQAIGIPGVAIIGEKIERPIIGVAITAMRRKRPRPKKRKMKPKKPQKEIMQIPSIAV